VKRHGLIESTIETFTRAMSRALMSEQLAVRGGLLQQLDPRVRLAGILMLVIAVVMTWRISVLAGLFLVAVAIAVMSHVPLLSLAKRVWLVVFAFTGLIAVPALFLTPGHPILTLPVGSLGITAPGLRTASLLILRVETAVTLTTVLVLCTLWNDILKALRLFRIPAEAVTMLAMTHRYIFLLLESTNQMFESRKSRAVGPSSGSKDRRMIARSAGVLLSKSVDLGQDVFSAMLSRGYRGEVHLLKSFHMRGRDYMAAGLFLALSSAAVWMGMR
jgi:cobalt/nickel transport system permease protein